MWLWLTYPLRFAHKITVFGLFYAPTPSCLWKGWYLIHVICVCLRIEGSNTSWLYKLWVTHKRQKLLILRDHLGASPFRFWRCSCCSSFLVLCVEVFLKKISSCVLFAESLQCLWTVHSWLSLRFSRTFI
jgi:hypothetical protein